MNTINACDIKRDTYYKEWHKFVETGNCDPKVIRPIILDSWKRCRTIGLDPFNSKKSCCLEDKHKFQEIIQKSNLLIKIAKPYMNILSGLVAGTGFMGSLISRDGYILETVGDTELLRTAEAEFLKPGAIRTENIAGTNAIGLCLYLKQPVQTFSTEHYNVHHHSWTCASAPVCDEFGQLVGVLNLSGQYNLIHKHTLGIVVSMAKAMEREINLTVMNTYLRSSIDSSEYGIIVLDNKLNVKQINKIFLQYLSRPSDEVLGKRIQDVLPNETEFPKLLNEDNKYFEKSITIKNPKNDIALLVNTQSIFTDDGKFTGKLMLTKEKRDIHRLVHRIVGAHATFTFDNILGKNEHFVQTIELAKKVAPTSARVLIQGESGTGKELFAQAIHNASTINKGPFIAINCSAIPSELLESELFGYNEGAFSGAKRGGMPGKFELAEGGTFFLDEIDSMPYAMQIKLLRVLEENKIMRIGGDKVIPINVRIIAASGKNLEELVQQGRMRLDLYYRINTIILDIPPLRERKEDVVLLAEHFMFMSCRKLGVASKRLSPEFILALRKYDWPGNIRELSNCIERAIIISNAQEVLLPGHLRMTSLQTASFKAAETDNPPILTSAKTLREIEQQAIIDTLKQTNNNYALTAKILGIHRNTLYNKLKEMS